MSESVGVRQLQRRYQQSKGLEGGVAAFLVSGDGAAGVQQIHLREPGNRRGARHEKRRPEDAEPKGNKDRP